MVFQRRCLSRWLVLLAWVSVSVPALADGEISFRDAEDGQFDASDYLLNHSGALPVPVVITEPMIGYGGGAMLLFFSESMAEAGAKAKDSGTLSPPNITGVGGAMTENGTWAGGAFHFHTWDGDRIRYIGGIARVNANLDYYGLSNQARAYQLQGDVLVQQVLFRLGKSNLLIGPRYTYFSSTATFKNQFAGELGNEFKHDLDIGKVGLVVDYDSRDNIFMPNRGSYAELEAQAARPWAGSSRSFDTYATRAYTWLPLAKEWILGLRADLRFTDGDVPFYAQPFIKLRGVEQGRYQDRNAVMAEAELRWNVTPRWSLLGFGGVGKAYGRWHDFSDAETVGSGGVGFRYLVARKLGLGVGLDVAHSKGQNAFYIQVGSAWK